MSEAQLQRAVIDTARLLGWRVAHFRPGRTSSGWRTPVMADGAGFPDLVCVRRGRLLFVELKAAAGRLAPSQTAWLAALAECGLDGGCEVHVWRPLDWKDGTVEAVLRGEAAMPAG